MVVTETEGQGRWSGKTDSCMQVRRKVAIHTAFHGELNKFLFSNPHNSNIDYELT